MHGHLALAALAAALAAAALAAALAAAALAAAAARADARGCTSSLCPKVRDRTEPSSVRQPELQ